MIEPFQSAEYRKQEKRGLADHFCCLCGRPIKDHSTARHITVVNGGSFGPPDSDQRDPGYMGHFSIGPDCWRNNPELHPWEVK